MILKDGIDFILAITNIDHYFAHEISSMSKGIPRIRIQREAY